VLIEDEEKPFDVRGSVLLPPLYGGETARPSPSPRRTARRFANDPRCIAAKYATRLRYAAKRQASRPGWRHITMQKSVVLRCQDRVYAPIRGPWIMEPAATHR
jgi:hypothetical protein